MPSWIQDPETGKLIPKELFKRQGQTADYYVQGALEPFISPVTKELITSREQLRLHNKEHGITNSADYSDEYMAKKIKQREDRLNGNTHQAKTERIELIKRVLREAGIEH